MSTIDIQPAVKLYELLLRHPVVSIFYIVLLWLGLLTWRRKRCAELKSIPGPRWAAISGIWLWIHDLKGTAPSKIKELHERHGSIVRGGSL